MTRDKLKDAMARRSPLTPRESVAPVDLYTVDAAEVVVDKLTSQQDDKRTSGDEDVSTSQHGDMLPSQPAAAAGSPRRRYTTYLKPQTIKAIKRQAVDGERNDYEIVQEALDEYLRRRI
jgi:hypothetical protein